LVAYSSVGAVALLVAVIAGRPALVGLAAPLLVAALAGLLVEAPAKVTVGTSVDNVHVLEGDVVTIRIRVSSRPGIDVDVALGRTGQLEPVDDVVTALVRTDGAGGGEAVFDLRAARWGAYRLGLVAVRTRDRLSFFRRDTVVDQAVAIRVHPRTETLRSIIEPSRTQLPVGSRLARTGGDGVEFADLRPYAYGDRLREVNWRATARAGQIWVNRRHPDRNSDVVILLDNFSDLALPDVVRATAALVSGYIGRRDRVGLIRIGGVMSWVKPATGVRHAHRIVEHLLESSTFANAAWKDLRVIPKGALPTGALVVALTAMDDVRITTAIEDLHARGLDVVVLELALPSAVQPGAGPGGLVAHRLWRLVRDARRIGWQRQGIPIVAWNPGDPVPEVIAQVERLHRHRQRRVG
jgi:uncharacterized protein (DUF58 family)